jgi:hypothetical protein
MILSHKTDAERTIRPGYWFRPKKLGWGAAPATWQGWAVTIGFAALAALIANTAQHRGPDWLWLFVPLTLGFVWLAWVKTDGDWGWRWGSDDR